MSGKQEPLGRIRFFFFYILAPNSLGNTISELIAKQLLQNKSSVFESDMQVYTY